MTPRLAAIAGPLKGTTVELTEREVSIGRDPSNALPIADLSMSRRHCLITCDEDKFALKDLDSFNGTLVNGVPVNERTLEHGDEIKIGDSVFVFLLEDAEDRKPSNDVELDEAELGARSTVRLRVEDALYLNSERVLAQLPDSQRITCDLNALLKISTAVNSIRDVEPLKQRLLELLFEVIPAEFGAIVLTSDDGLDPNSIFGLRREPAHAQPLHISATVVRRVLRERVAILSCDVAGNEDFGGAQSLVASETSSLLCVPLTLFDKALGVLYLGTSNPTTGFDEDHLQLATAAASVAAVAFENARRAERLQNENLLLKDTLQLEQNMVGESARIRSVYQFIARVAPTDSTVLILGENGTGKELAARAIHKGSSRADQPLVAINCASLSETLLESELFGHEKGAFTGAVAQKKGKLEIADGGTLFLDEVGELAPQLQARLLRVLQEREFERVGGTRTIRTNIRLIAATNRNLEEAMRDGSFRQDLYYRLNVVQLTMPALRDRPEDVPLLTRYFIAKFGRQCKRQVSGVSEDARRCMMSYDWPGNVRELENAIERAVVLGSSDIILPEDLPEALTESEAPDPETAEHAKYAKYHEAINELKRRLIIDSVAQAGGNYTEAARALGVHPNYLHRLIRNLNLKAALKK
ncbi:MAG TPA: sigma 54-interacting transcriptional regulator [Blastocatellia bacterium]|nr:sigma 54-interacting transcriptional regulator [Blastocatellia bacterium]